MMRQLFVLCCGVLGTFLLTTSFEAQEPAPEDTPPAAETGAAEDPVAPQNEPHSLPAQFEVALDREEITVGDRVKATLTLVWMGAEPSAPARFPTWQETWGDAEVLATSPVEAFVDQSGRRVYRQELQLTAFEVGEVRLPAVQVALPFAENTLDLSSEGATSFEVVSVLPPEPDPAAAPGTPGGPPGVGPPVAAGPAGAAPDDTAAEPPELRPAAPPLALPTRPLFWWTAGLMALACGLATLGVDQRLRNLPEALQAPEPVLEPYEELVQRLVELDPADTEPTHTALSLGLRRYLGRTLAFQATESTTSEIQRRLRNTSLGAAGVQPLVQLFRSCDQVKFARQQVAPEVTRERLRQARQLAQDIEESLRPAPQVATESTQPAGQGSSNSATPSQGRAA